MEGEQKTRAYASSQASQLLQALQPTAMTARGEKLFVIKVGGSIFRRMGNLVNDLPNYTGRIILVHGGAAETTEMARRMGLEPRFITSPSGFKSRRCDRETMEVFGMVVGGKINKEIVRRLHSKGVNAVGISGADGGLLMARRKIIRAVENGKEKIIRDDYTGKIEHVNGPLLLLLSSNGYLPVVAPIALSNESDLLNVDGDRAAAAIARAVGAERLIILTDVDGYYENFPQDFVPMMAKEQLPGLMEKAKAGMKRKLLAAKEALEGGVMEVIIANGLKEKPVTSALEGKGTIIR